MSDQSNATTAAGRLAAVQQKLDRVHADLTRERRRAAAATRVTALVAAVALVALAAYFYYGYTKISSVAKADTLVDYAELLVNDNLPQARSALEEQIKESAPAVAETLSKQLQESMPSVRKELTTRFVEEADRQTQETLVLTEDKYRSYLRNNKPLLKKKFDELADSPTLAEQSLAELEVPLEQELAADLKVDAKQLSRDIASITKNLEYLAAGKGLTPEQKVERRVWMLARRLQLNANIPAVEGAVDGLADKLRLDDAAAPGPKPAPTGAAKPPAKPKGEASK